MSDEIQNALTPEEWKDFRDSRAEAAFAIMGLANASLPDDDPRKITRKDVMAIEDAASSLRAEYGSGDEDAYDLDHLAAKLAALLPPNA